MCDPDKPIPRQASLFEFNIKPISENPLQLPEEPPEPKDVMVVETKTTFPTIDTADTKITPPKPDQSTQTNSMPKRELLACKKLLSTLKKHENAWPFLLPVDPIELEIPDYFTIVSAPMDLTTCQTNLTNGLYSSLEHMAKDLTLIWENCSTFNGADHPLTLFGFELSKIVEDYVYNFRNPPLPKKKPPQTTIRTTPAKVKKYSSTELTLEEKHEMIAKIAELNESQLFDLFSLIHGRTYHWLGVPGFFAGVSETAEEVHIDFNSLSNTMRDGYPGFLAHFLALRAIKDFLTPETKANDSMATPNIHSPPTDLLAPQNQTKSETSSASQSLENLFASPPQATETTKFESFEGELVDMELLGEFNSEQPIDTQPTENISQHSADIEVD